MYQIITGKIATPMVHDEPQASLSKLSEHFNTYAGLRTNAALDVLAGPSPDTLIPPPQECDLPENAEQPLEEDWEAIYGDMGDTETPGGDPEYNGSEGQVRLDGAVLRTSTVAQAPDGLKVELLLAGMDELPRRMRTDTRLQKLFQKTLNHAVEDMEAYEGAERAGLAESSISMRGNRLRLVVRMQERALPPGCEATAELHINESI